MSQLTQRVYGVLTLQSFLNGYIVVHEDGTLTAIDAGMTGYFRAFERVLGQMNRTWKDVKRIFITHAHIDHVGGLAELQAKAPHAITYVHRLDAPIVRGEQLPQTARAEELGIIGRMMLPFVAKNRTAPARVDETPEDGNVLNSIAQGATVILLNGHSHGQIGLWLPQERTLIGGDVMMRFPWGLSLPLRPPSVDWQAVKKSVHRVDALGVQTLCLGHGAPLVGNATPAIQALAQKLS